MSVPIYDMHAHIFPEKIASRAVSSIGDFYGIHMEEKGYSGDLAAAEKKAGVKRVLVCSTATTPLQVSAINSFIAGEAGRNPGFIGFGSLHPAFDDIPGEIERMERSGLRGIKLHPDFQRFAIDDPEAYGIYEAAEGRLPVLFHTGDKRYGYSNPHRVLRILKDFPKLTVICAHLGGYSEWDKVVSLEGYLGHPNIYLDTSSAIQMMDPADAAAIIKRHGTDRVFWGTDYPMWDPSTELGNFMRLPLSDDDKEAILGKNAARFFGEDTD